jgi:TolA-binding protein
MADDNPKVLTGERPPQAEPQSEVADENSRRLDKLELRVGALQETIEELELNYNKYKQNAILNNFNAIEAKIDGIGTKLDSLKRNLGGKLDSLERKMDDNYASLEKKPGR